jgi:hypothetical protein
VGERETERDRERERKRTRVGEREWKKVYFSYRLSPWTPCWLSPRYFGTKEKKLGGNPLRRRPACSRHTQQVQGSVLRPESLL